MRKLIVDLRWNSGGNSLPGSRFADAVAPGFERGWTFDAYAAGIDPALDLVLAQP